MKVREGEDGKVEMKTKYKVKVRLESEKQTLPEKEWVSFEPEAIKRIVIGD